MKFGIEKRRTSALIRREQDIVNWTKAAKDYPPDPGTNQKFDTSGMTWVNWCGRKKQIAERDVEVLRGKQTSNKLN
jgi:hypothetical protein